MRAVVAIRPSPHRVGPDPEAEGVATHGWLAHAGDLVALEAAKRHADHVIAVGVGDDRAETAIAAGVRAGADEAVHVAYDPVGEPLGEKYGTVLADAIKRIDADALFVGDDAPTMGAEAPAVVGERLDWPSTTAVTAIGPEAVESDVAEDNRDIIVQRRLAAGRQEILALDPPVVLGIDSGFANPTRGSLDDVIAAQRTEASVYDLSSVSPSESRFSMSVGSVTVRRMTANERIGRGVPPQSGSVEKRIRSVLGHDGDEEGADGTGGEVITVPPDEAADRVVDLLTSRELL
jgi:electron transfer flavoprotein alpha/beta subunit